VSGLTAKSEPCNLREWSVNRGRLLTCGRPGRGHYAAGALPQRGVPEDILLAWADGLGVAKVVHLVSLLGTKSNGTSEFKYYPFRSCEEPGDRPTLQEWLSSIKLSAFVVLEYPTTDYQTIPADQVRRIVECVRRLLAENRTVVLLDSAGAVRTKQVREAIGFTKLKAALTQSCV
jgi:hypothetical protein